MMLFTTDLVYLGQPRPTKTVLRDILSEAGLNKESKVAVIGLEMV